MIAEIAERQHGVIARRQLAGLGLGRGAIAHLLSAGRIHRLYRSVYAVGHRQLTLHGRWMAAVLAGGAGAVLSHLDAAALWGVLASGGMRFHVTVAARGRTQPRGLVLHQVRSLDPRDRTVRDGIPVTSLARTLLDVAEVAPRRLQRAFDEADRLQLLDVRAVEKLCERSPGRRGLKPLLAVLAEAQETPRTKSEFEALFFEFCRAEGLPLPICNAHVEGFEVDAFWPAHNLIVELDSWTFHRGRRAFERDRERLAALQAARYRVIPVTWRRLTQHPADVAAQLRRLMA